MLAAMDAALDNPDHIGDLNREISAHWTDRRYQPSTDGAWMQDPSAAAALTVGGMRRALTYFMRAERFAEGFQRHATSPSGIGRLRDRLAVLVEQGAFTLPACFSPPDSTWAAS